MKKSLLIFSVLAVLAITGCSKGGNGGSSGGGSSGGSSGGEEEKHNEIAEAVENTHVYAGSFTYSFDMVMGIDESQHEKVSYNADNHLFYETGDGHTYVAVPQENNLCKYYLIDDKNPANSSYETTSLSFVDRKGLGAIQDGEGLYYSSLPFVAISESYYKYGDTKMFDKIFLIEMNDEMFAEMGVQASVEGMTSSFAFGDPVDGVKSATYQISGVANSGDAEYPKVDYSFKYTISYNDKVVSLKQFMEFDYKLDGDMHMSSSMVMGYAVDYSFDQENYDKYLANTASVTTNQGYRENYLSLVFNGVDMHETWSTFEPNEPITEEKIKSFLNSHYSSINNNATLDGIYTDPEYTELFEERNSTNYYEKFYLKMTPKEGYSFLEEQYNVNITKGSLALTDEEFALFGKMSFFDEEPRLIYSIIPNTADYNVTYNNQYDQGMIASMQLNGEPFNSNKITKEVLATKAEHKLVFEVEKPYHQYGSKNYHAILADREIFNNDSGILFAGPIDQYELYVNLNTSDYKKASRAGTVKAYKVDHLLAKGEALPASAELLNDTQIKISFVAGSSTTDTLPDSFEGQFTIIANPSNKISFVYLLLE